jgi:hypothetical protein
MLQRNNFLQVFTDPIHTLHYSPLTVKILVCGKGLLLDSLRLRLLGRWQLDRLHAFFLT